MMVVLALQIPVIYGTVRTVPCSTVAVVLFSFCAGGSRPLES